MAIPTALAWPLRVARLGAIGAHSLIGLFLWVIAWGGRGCAAVGGGGRVLLSLLIDRLARTTPN